MAIILESTYNIDTGELISREVVGHTDRNPTPDFVELLYEKWLHENPDNESA